MKRFIHSAIFSKMAFSFILILLAGTAFSQKALQPFDDWTVQVLNQLRTYEDRLDLSNQSHEIVTGQLNDDGTEWINIEIPAGKTYYILGVCDNDCFDLDLELYTIDNSMLSQDVETDDYPLVSVTPSEQTVYRIKVVMANCSSGPCRYGLGVYKSE
ncbi:MAG: hypothetical protein RBS53_06880 [Bacteroidales bacterium]|jgi:hypothetical protein|nr:hypothetical protein [Bacteroidales bacterium]NLM92524.1 hypothetical protein [Bacteroidales bacterium]